MSQLFRVLTRLESLQLVKDVFSGYWLRRYAAHRVVREALDHTILVWMAVQVVFLVLLVLLSLFMLFEFLDALEGLAAGLALVAKFGNGAGVGRNHLSPLHLEDLFGDGSKVGYSPFCVVHMVFGS